MIALLLKGTRAVRKPPSASTVTFPSGNAQLHVHSALGPHGWGRVTMATLQSSLSDSFTMYNRSVYRKNADRIFWFSSVLLTRKECRAHQKKRSARCRFPGHQLKLPRSRMAGVSCAPFAKGGMGHPRRPLLPNQGSPEMPPGIS